MQVSAGRRADASQRVRKSDKHRVAAERGGVGIATRLEVEALGEGVEADARALAPDLSRLWHLEQRLLEDAQLPPHAVRVLQLDKHRPEPPRAAVHLKRLVRLRSTDSPRDVTAVSSARSPRLAQVPSARGMHAERYWTRRRGDGADTRHDTNVVLLLGGNCKGARRSADARARAPL
eukprot:4402785-Pleurochrysis_carterae.AAC.8